MLLLIHSKTCCWMSKWLLTIFLLLQEGRVRAKLEKILASYDDVHFERSTPTTQTIKVVCTGVMRMMEIDYVIAYLSLK